MIDRAPYLMVTAIVLSAMLRISTGDAQENVNLEVGAPAPSFEAIDQDGRPWKSSDVIGKKLLAVYFYPAAHTGGCTKQACAFRDDKEELAELGVEVVGVSGDEAMNLRLFKDDQDLNFTLLADFDGTVAKKFGVPVGPAGEIEREFGGTTYVLKRGVTAKRWTFLIDKQGKVVWKDTQVNAAEDSKSILAAAQQAQASP